MDKVKWLFIGFVVIELLVVAFVIINNHNKMKDLEEQCKEEFGTNYDIVRINTPFSTKIVCQMKAAYTNITFDKGFNDE